MNPYKVTITRAGAEALRDFAMAIPYTIEMLEQDTEQLIRRCNSLLSDLGELSDSFDSMIKVCLIAIEYTKEEMSSIPEDLRRTADAIDEFLDDCPDLELSGSGTAGASPFDGSTRIGAAILDTKHVTRRR
ncbi:hypothetical protein [Collinsella ihumii]|uniref:Cell division protein ZapA n=1 Tax=Collinsella ihumii TaxID=1720204 RepID=A0AAW7K3E5_9ACTN|nr:hypothetical protein [Collinsella ihumii]MDN0069727.1 hypothetical protein [Collinsella ihumii]